MMGFTPYNIIPNDQAPQHPTLSTLRVRGRGVRIPIGGHSADP